MDRTMRVHARPPLNGDKFPHLFASMSTASFVSMLGEKLFSSFLATFEEKFRSRSAQKAGRKLPGRHGRVFSADRG
jgi:hypothetical protein